jgi:hypothetical protein
VRSRRVSRPNTELTCSFLAVVPTATGQRRRDYCDDG